MEFQHKYNKTGYWDDDDDDDVDDDVDDDDDDGGGVISSNISTVLWRYELMIANKGYKV